MAAEVRSHAGALAYTAAMSTAATDALGSLERTLAAMGRHQVRADAVGHLVAARNQAAVMATALTNAHQALTGHTVVGEAYTAAPDAGDKTWMADDGPGRHRAPEPRKDTMPPTTLPAVNDPDRPRDVADVLGYADGDTCHGTDQVTGTSASTALALMDYGDGGGRWEGGRYVAVATTAPGRWHPVTNEQQISGDSSLVYVAPDLNPTEAETVAQHLDDLAAMAESGYRPPKPTRYGRAAQRLQHLVDVDTDLAKVKVTIGDDELPLTVRDLLTLLRKQDQGVDPAARRHVTARASETAGGDGGAVWMRLVDVRGTARIAVTAVEGTDDPDDDYWKPHTAQHTPAQARELADKLRTFARAAAHPSDTR